jgi:hypothetical protein
MKKNKFNLKNLVLVVSLFITTTISLLFLVSLGKVPIRESYIDFLKNFTKNELNILNHYSDEQKVIINSQLYRFLLHKKSLIKYTNFNHYNSSRLPSGYLEKFGKNFVFVSGDGKVIIFDKELKIIREIKSNLKKIMQNQRPPRGWYSLRDITADNNNSKIFYISYYKRCDENKWKMSVLKTEVEDFSTDKITFNDIDPFENEQCISKPNSTHSGGRIINFDNQNLLITVGDWLMDLAQDDKSIYGKIIKLRKDGKDYNIFSKGHRNPQGLAMINKNYIFSSEHGHWGGDELNRIIEGENYGWPIVSYSTRGEDQRLNKINIDPYNSDKKHDYFGYKEPIISLTPAIGPSELIVYNGNDFSLWKDKIILSSLKSQSFYILTMDQNYEKIRHMEKIHIGSRIRDFIFSEDAIYIVLEGRYANQKDTPNLGKLTIE